MCLSSIIINKISSGTLFIAINFGFSFCMVKYFLSQLNFDPVLIKAYDIMKTIEEVAMRELSQNVQTYLEKEMASVIQRVNCDKELVIGLRSQSINIYHQGISILLVMFGSKATTYHMSGGIVRQSYTSLKKAEKNKRIQLLLEEMDSIRQVFMEFGFHLIAKVSKSKKRDNRYFQSFIEEKKLNPNIWYNEVVEDWIHRTNDYQPKNALPFMTYDFMMSDKVEASKVLDFWLEHLDDIKRLVDIYFETTKVYKEKILQNYLVRHYPSKPMVPIDMEYNVPSTNNKERKGRPDIIAVASDAMSLIEVKFNDSALKGSSGVSKHVEDFVSLISETNQNQLHQTIEEFYHINGIKKKLQVMPFLEQTQERIKKICFEIIYGYDDAKYLASMTRSIKAFKEQIKDAPRKIRLNDRVIRVEYIIYLISCEFDDCYHIKKRHSIAKEVIFY